MESSNRVRKPHVVAEIGGNHRGSVETAKEMIMIAAQFCKADVVKFQKRTPRECLSEAEYNAPHPNSANSYGHTYGQHREFLEFDLDTHKQLKEHCEQFSITYSTSVWDMTSAREMAGLNPKLIKVPSACNTYFEMMDVLCGDYGGDIHVSLGMTTHQEEEEIVEYFRRKGRAKDVVLYHCTSGYPVEAKDLNLLEIPRLAKAYGDIVKGIGYSGHHLGIAADVAAFTLGADWAERHFTLDRTWKGTDHAASLEPDGLRRVVRDLRAVALALQTKKQDILPVEAVQRKKLKWDRNRSK
jgi:N-acetylneuraminate synthase